MTGATIKRISILRIPGQTAGTATLSEMAGTALANYFKFHWRDLIILTNSGLFELKNGKYVIHKDNDGRIRRVERIDVPYES